MHCCAATGWADSRRCWVSEWVCVCSLFSMTRGLLMRSGTATSRRCYVICSTSWLAGHSSSTSGTSRPSALYVSLSVCLCVCVCVCVCRWRGSSTGGEWQLGVLWGQHRVYSVSEYVAGTHTHTQSNLSQTCWLTLTHKQRSFHIKIHQNTINFLTLLTFWSLSDRDRDVNKVRLVGCVLMSFYMKLSSTKWICLLSVSFSCVLSINY